MRWSRLVAFAVALLAVFEVAPAVAAGGGPDSAHPVIAVFGAMKPLPDAAVQPDASTVYRVVFDLASAEAEAAWADGLETVARAVNLFASAGVPTENLKFVVVLHGPITAAVLDNEHYREQRGQDNPNREILSALKKVGVEIEVCGQALAAHKFEHAWVSKDVVITLSALSDLIVYSQQGYTIIKL